MDQKKRKYEKPTCEALRMPVVDALCFGGSADGQCVSGNGTSFCSHGGNPKSTSSSFTSKGEGKP